MDADADEVERFWEQASELFCVLEAESGRFLRVNPAWTRTLGWTEDQLLGRRATDLLHRGDTWTAAAVEADPVTGEMVVRDVENRYRHIDGSYRWLRWKGHLRDGRFFGMASDISGTRASEMTIRLNERRARAVLEALDDGLFIAGGDGQVLEANEQFARLVGVSAHRILGSTPPYPWWPDEHVARMQALHESAQNGATAKLEEGTLITADGRTITVRESLTPFPYDPTQPALLVVVRDISEHVVVRNRLLRAHRRARMMIWEWYPAEEQFVVLGNGLSADGPAVQELTRDDALGDVIERADEVSEALDAVYAGRTGHVDLDARVSVAGASPWVRIQGDPILSEDGDIIGVHGTVRAILAPRERVSRASYEHPAPAPTSG